MRFAVPALLLSLVVFGSSIVGSPVAGLAVLHAQAPSRFAAFEHCKFADDLGLVENIALPSGVQGRTVKTVMGPRQVPLTGGRTLVFGYPHTEPFATVKVEQIASGDYPQARQDLIANFEQILTGDDSSARNLALPPRLHGMEVYGLDRKTLDGGVLGMYLFFVDRTHTATTIYFLNQDPAVRSFQNLTDYAGLRDTFLSAYTGCAAGLPRGRVAAAHAEPTIPLAAPAAAVMALPDAPAVPASAPPASPAVQTSPAVPSEAAPDVRRSSDRDAARTPAARKPITAAQRRAAERKQSRPSSRKTTKAPSGRSSRAPVRKKK